jgi:peptidyl-prolyl cis-trans isomerase SurA
LGIELYRGPPAGAAVAIICGLILSACASSKEVVRAPPQSENAAQLTGRTTSDSAIPVLVNDTPVTKYDIDQRARLIRIAGGKGGKKAATEELIVEALQMGEAKRLGFKLPEERVAQGYAGIAGNLKMSTKQLDAALKSEGINPATLKRRIRVQSTWGELVSRRARNDVQISSADLTTALLEKGDPAGITMFEYTLKEIIFVVPSGSAGAVYTQRGREANAFRQRFKGCETILEQTRTLKGVVVKNIGRRGADQLGGPQAAEIMKTEVGKATPPVRSDQGFELIAVCATREVRSTAQARAEIQSKYTLEQADGLGDDYLKELRDAAIIQYR